MYPEAMRSENESARVRGGPMAERGVRLAVAILTSFAGACGPRDAGRASADSLGSGDRRLTVYNAGSLAIPLRAALDSFAARERVTIEQENAGSLETARKLTELGKIPDMVAVADYEVIPLLLVPQHATWYAKFARNRMVLAYEDRSRGASEITTDNWWQVVTRPDVQVGRADPSLDPNGYRTLLVWQRACSPPRPRETLGRRRRISSVSSRPANSTTSGRTSRSRRVWAHAT